MRPEKIDSIVYRLISGYEIYNVDGFNIKYSPPSRLQLVRAESYWNECFERNKFSGLLRDDESEAILCDLGLWSTKKTEELTILRKKPKEIRIAMYEAYEMGAPWKHLKKTLAKTEKKLYNLEGERSYLTLFSLEGLCSWTTHEIIVQDCCDFPMGFKKTTANFAKVLSLVTQGSLGQNQIDEAIRSNLFGSYWNVSKHDMFDCDFRDANFEQRTAASLAATIDKAYDSAESPDPEVVRDPDLFQGWLDTRSDRGRTQKLKSEIDSKVSSGKSKVFVVANERMSAEDIYNMNTPANKARIKQMGKENGTKK